MLSPAKVKFRKQQRGKMRGLSKGGTNVDFGEFGLQALGCGWVTARQIEAGRVAIMRHVRRAGKLWIRMFPDKPIGKKPAETRMGKGKAVPEEWIAVVRPGRVLYELGGIPKDIAKEAFRLAAHKLPIRSRFVAREVI
ncbi:MAG: 50S ribosomal protein L16 [Deltaproteobacteria bacterium]|nr:50S ribosomal protein L16 [Deltaproteobacteria bacterium]